MNKKRYAIGVDIGGSHVSSAVVDIAERKIVKDTCFSLDVNNKSSAPQIINAWAQAITQSIHKIEKSELSGIGFAMPGPFEYDKGIARFSKDVDKFENLFGENIAEHITKIFAFEGNASVRFMNDATAFAVGEAWLGKAAGYKRSVAITLGTGFGSAFINNGLPVLTGPDVPKMGCVWHLPFKEGIGDDYFSTRWFIKNAYEKTGKKYPGVKEIADLARNSQENASIFMEYGTNLGYFLGPWLKKFEAEILVIGGNVSGAYDLIKPGFEGALTDIGVKSLIESISGLMENAAIIGSSRMFEDGFWDNLQPMLIEM